MPNRILNCTQSASDSECTVDFSFSLRRPPAGEGGTARVTFSGDVSGSDSTDVDGSAAMTSEASSCCTNGPVVSIAPTSGSWDDVQDCGDITATLQPS